MDDKNNEKYEYIDVEGLSNCLSEDAWKEETRNVDQSDLYELVFDEEEGSMIMKKQITPKWATLFFNLKEQFTELINSFRKR